MLNFEEWDKTNIVIVDETMTGKELNIRPKGSWGINKDDITVSFEKGFGLAKEMGWGFTASNHLSSIKIYLEIQKELNRPVRDYIFLSIMNWKTKEKLVCPRNADEELVKQYNLANAILGYQNSYELLNDETKSHFQSCKECVEGIVARNQ